MVEAVGHGVVAHEHGDDHQCERVAIEQLSRPQQIVIRIPAVHPGVPNDDRTTAPASIAPLAEATRTKHGNGSGGGSSTG